MQLVLRTLSLLPLMALVFVAGCSEDGETDRIRLLGLPPSVAYVGQEFTYEVGIAGGEGPYEFTLSNNPAWLAVEYNDNPLRPGLLLRGIPGLTGGQTTEDSLIRTFENIQITVSDGKYSRSEVFTLGVQENTLRFLPTEVPEADQQDRPRREVFNTDTRRNDLVDIPLCMVDADNQPTVTEEDLEYWLDLIDYYERQEEGETLTDEEIAELGEVFGNLTPEGRINRPRIVYAALNLEDAPIVADSEFSYLLEEPRINTGNLGDPDPADPVVNTTFLTEGEDYLTSVRKKDGSTLNLISGRLLLPSGEDTCPLLIFVNDDRTAEKDESLQITLTNESDHDYLVETLQGRVTVEDNEPTPSFRFELGSITETANQLGFEDPLQEQGTIYEMVVQLDDVPVQDQTADHFAEAYMAFRVLGSDGDFGIIDGVAELPGLADPADLIADVSPAYLSQIDEDARELNGVTLPEDTVVIRFGEETVEEDGEEVQRWITERTLYFYAPVNDTAAPPGGGDPSFLPDSQKAEDETVSFEWLTSPTVFEDDNTHVVRISQWSDTKSYVLPLDGGIRAIRSGTDGAAYVGYQTMEDGLQVANIDYYNRIGELRETLNVRFDGVDFILKDIEVYEAGIPSRPDTTNDRIQEIFVLGEVEALVAPPVVPGDTSNLGGKDLVIAMFRRVNRVGEFEPVWSRQFGTALDDEGSALTINTDNKVFVVGQTPGDFNDFINLGGTDGLIALFTREGELEAGRLYGTAGDDGLNDAVIDANFNVFSPGFTGFESEIGASGGGLDYLALSISDDMTLRRVNQFGGSLDQVGTAASRMTRGFFTGGYTRGQFFLEPNAGGEDAFVAYQQSASAIESLFQLGTAGDDSVTATVSTGYQGVVAGYTEGALFEDLTHVGGKDWWMASYRVIQPDPDDNDRALDLLWQYQGDDIADESVSAMSMTAYGKFFRVIERQDADAVRSFVSPVAMTDGRRLSAAP